MMRNFLRTIMSIIRENPASALITLIVVLFFIKMIIIRSIPPFNNFF